MTGLRRSIVVLVLVLVLVALALPSWLLIAAGDVSAQRDTLQVGSERLSRCEDSSRIWCGLLEVPLDRDDPLDGTLDIGFAWRPATGQSQGTVVAQEGGPGYPSIGSMGLWRGLFGPLLEDHDLLVVDARGTGKSQPIDCPALQEFDQVQTDEEFHRAIAACGRQLNTTFIRDGEYVHASDLFGTADAVDDMAAIITALDAGPVDLYGDSYGSFFAQAFGARHPELVRSLVLDGTWPLVDADPWYPETLATLRFAFDAVCARSAACRVAAPGSATERLALLADELAAHPITGDVPRSGASAAPVTVTATDLAALAWSAGSSSGIYRDLDAAGRAARNGDPLPLLRIAARAGLNGTLSGGWPAETYSVGHAVAVPCTDYPQLYDMSAAPGRRVNQFESEVALLPDDFFSPFSLDDWLGNPIQDYDQCVRWPAPTHERELAPEGFPLVPESVPVLILAGDLDSVTALGGAETALEQLGASARLVLVPSSTHVVAQSDVVGCGSAIVREFLQDPDRVHVQRLDTSCAGRFPEIRATGIFPLRLENHPLPAPAPGNEASVEQQRLAALAVATAGDVAAYPAKRGRTLQGLRGGMIATSEARDPLLLTLTDVRYTEDVAVSGTVTVPKDPAAPIVAELTATADNGSRVRITATWNPLQPVAIATIRGVAEDAQGTRDPLRATMPAP